MSSGVRPAGRWLPSFEHGEEAKRFFVAIQGEIGRLALYSLQEAARRYVHGEVPTRTQSKTISMG
jgi:hypothetical protein